MSTASPLELIPVFQPEVDGYPCCRIPSVVTAQDGTLLAFCEGRQRRNDHAQNDIVLKRSHDHGSSWEPARAIASQGADSLNDPSAVVDRNTGRIVLHYTRFAEGYHTPDAVPGYDHPHSARNYVIHSDDNGASWSEPMEVTRQVKRPDVRCAVTTCGIGIQLRRTPYAGRLVHAVYQFGGEPDRQAYVIYSDDGGSTWEKGECALTPDGDWAAEPQVVELTDGRIMLNARTRMHRRKVGASSDGGGHFTELEGDPALIEPGCQASIFRYSDPLDGDTSRILFSNPAMDTERSNGTVRLSLDEGATWPVSRTVYAESFAYSCLARLADDRIGCLFEADNCQRIVLGRFPLEWLV